MRELRLYWALYCCTCRKPIAVERTTWAQDGDGVQVANPAKLPEYFSVKCSDCSDNHDYKSDSIYQELFPVMLSRDTKLVPVERLQTRNAALYPCAVTKSPTLIMSTVSHRSGRYASPVISADLGTESGKPRSAATALAPASAGADADTSQPSEPFTFIPPSR